MPRRRVEGLAIQRGASDLWRKVGEPSPGAHCRGYVRFSHEAGHYGLTVPGQKDHIRVFAEAHGWTLDGFDEEPARSAKYDEIEDRPVFAAHLEAAASGAFAVSLAYMNDRWARNPGVAYASLSRLRRSGVYWATTDGRWNIDRIQEDGWDIAYAVDAAMNAAYSRKVSEKTRIGKETRARLGFHNGDVPFGYLRPADPPRPEGAPLTWKPPRQALIAHPTQFAQLQQMGRWAASGLSDQQIADKCNAQGWLTATNKRIGPRRRFVGEQDDGELVLDQDRSGARPFGKDTVRALLLRHFPREFKPGCGRGTILTPSGERVEGQHRAAWSWELWHRIDEQRAARRGSLGQQRARRAWPLSSIAVCAACGERLRANSTVPFAGRRRRYTYYTDTARSRGLNCPDGGQGRIAASQLEDAAVALLLAHPIPSDWRARIAEAAAQLEDATDWGAIERKRAGLARELERIKFQHRHALLTDAELVRETDRIRQALDLLPERDDAASGTPQASLSAGAMLVEFANYWQLATPEERVEMFRLMLVPCGLRVDLTSGEIVGVRPRRDFLPMLSLTLLHAANGTNGAGKRWHVHDDGWLLPYHTGERPAVTAETETDATDANDEIEHTS